MTAPAVDEKILDEKLGALEAARQWQPRVIAKLEALIRSGEDALAYPGVTEAVASCNVTPERADLCGVNEQLQICKVCLPPWCGCHYAQAGREPLPGVSDRPQTGDPMCFASG